jgi:hypothetical protein
MGALGGIQWLLFFILYVLIISISVKVQPQLVAHVYLIAVSYFEVVITWRGGR